jgi:hypothetical protein
MFLSHHAVRLSSTTPQKAALFRMERLEIREINTPAGQATPVGWGISQGGVDDNKLLEMNRCAGRCPAQRSLLPREESGYL